MRFIAKTFAALAIVSTGAAAAQKEWGQVEEKALGYSAVFPEAPKPDVRVEQGVTVKSNVGTAPGMLCLVEMGDYGQHIDAPAELAASRDNFVNGVGATVSTQKRTSFQRDSVSLPALEFDASNPTIKFRSIIVVDGQRVYQVTGGMPKEGGNEANLEHCVRGFRLLPK